MDPQEQPETDLAAAERRLADQEARVARQQRIVEEMERDNHPAAAAMGRTLLATLKKSLALSRNHVKALRGRPGGR